MTIQQVPGTDLTYYLVAYDKNGVERPDDPDGLMSDRIAQSIHDEQVTDVFVMSHGWKGDVPAAIEQYNRWITAMADCEADRAAMRVVRPAFKALLVGFHWPSEPWGEEEFATGAASFGVDSGTVDGSTTSATASLDTFVDQYADRIADTPRAREAIRAIMRIAMDAGPGTVQMPPEMTQAYCVLNDEANLGDAGTNDAPGEDRATFDPNRAFLNARAAASELPPRFGGFSFSDLLSPLRQLSFWQMKARGRKIGETSGSALLNKMMKAVPEHQPTRFHLMGHSFGCIVVTGMINGENGENGASVLPRAVSSLTLVQGATSLWGFCSDIPDYGKPGYFRKVIASKKVSGPIVTTQSAMDTAVGRFYPLAAGVALQVDLAAGTFPKYGGMGAFGIQGPGLSIEDQLVGNSVHAYKFQPGHIYNLECSSVIKDGSGVSGAHSDIAKPEIAHAVWEAAKLS